MPATLATILGGAMGLSVQLYSNAARRLPYMRLLTEIMSAIHILGAGRHDPWEHLLAIGLGSAFGNAMVKWEEDVEVELNKSIETARNANKKRFVGTVRVSQDEE